MTRFSRRRLEAPAPIARCARVAQRLRFAFTRGMSRVQFFLSSNCFCLFWRTKSRQLSMMSSVFTRTDSLCQMRQMYLLQRIQESTMTIPVFLQQCVRVSRELHLFSFTLASKKRRSAFCRAAGNILTEDVCRRALPTLHTRSESRFS